MGKKRNSKGSRRIEEKATSLEIHFAQKERRRKRIELKRKRDSRRKDHRKRRIPYEEEGSVE